MTTPTDKAFNTGRQLEIYRAREPEGLRTIPFDARRLRRKARRNVERRAWNFVDGGAGAEKTMEANLAAFDRWRIVPRMLQNVARRDASVTILGQRFERPMMVAPIGVQADFHPDGELATAAAAAETRTPFILLGVSSYSMEQVAAANGDGVRWFQLYWPKEKELALSFLDRAAASGYSAIVVTLDTQILGWRPRDLAAPHLPFLLGHGMGNYVSDPVFRASVPVPPEEDLRPAVERYLDVFSNPAHEWRDLRFIRESTALPIVIKGLQHPEDARRALDFGADAIVVSNHGGRQVDGAIGSLEALPRILDAVGGRVPVLFDSGIRGGADVFKALALGAGCTLIGRPYMYALAINGREGVRDLLLNFADEFDLTMALCAKRSIDQIGRGDVIHVREL